MFYEIENAKEVESDDAFLLDRTRTISAAIERHRDCRILGRLRNAESGEEYLIVDIETDEVPPDNGNGIQYRERVAFCVPTDEMDLIDVRALRHNFPVLPHQNHTAPGHPLSLCLYFEPTISVLRTWTPQNFLRRLQWWLSQSAKGELHPSDQPVEQLFFTGMFELVLPHTLKDTGATLGHKFKVYAPHVRQDGGVTLLYRDAEDPDVPLEIGDIECLAFTLEPVTHGRIEQSPATLGELVERLSSRGADVIERLKEAVVRRIGEQGANDEDDAKRTLFLLQIPICREEGDLPERLWHQAFVAEIGPLKLGVQIGALISHEGKYYSAEGVLGAKKVDVAHRNIEITPVDVLYENDRNTARTQSGLGTDDWAGVLVGAGALGSGLLNLWGRSGWGTWTVIDSDHVKPHNLSRHVAFTQQIGEPKAFVCAGLHSAVISDGEMTGIHADAMELEAASISDAMKEADFVIDTSTTLEYPRRVSSRDDMPRHCSAFLTPDGNSAVLLTEDLDRKIRLRSLEAQYYRAIIQSSWGSEHLRRNLGMFWSGGGCRDISTVLPLSRIWAHTATLSEQISHFMKSNEASICVWERDSSRGTVHRFDVSVAPENQRAIGEYTVYFDEALVSQLRELRSSELPNETGGVLLGYYDFNESAVVIVAGLPAPPDSVSTPTQFVRGVSGVADSVNQATERTAGIVGYVGEWHSHPPHHDAQPSRDDLVQLCYLTFGMAEDGLPALQLIIGEEDLQILQGQTQ